MSDKATIDPRTYTAPPALLAERIIMVTGAGDGIGAQAARTCAAFGATVILVGRTQAKLQAVHDAIVAAGHPEPSIASIDFARAQGDDYQTIAAAVEQTFGHLDGLLNNAGILGYLSPVDHYEVAKWLEVMHVNLNAPFILTQALLPLLQKSTDASIVFTSSSVGRRGRAFWGAYAVSKFGTEGLMQTLADELTDIRVNCINPGATRTAMRRKAYPGEDPSRLRTPAEIMAPYLYLLGPDSRGVSGQSFDCQ
ncbi:MAG: YciK family oxidoreductase [Gammaproteobacteria bacterium]|jgi:NAD(P)-dependent dehydrogenase (short-subunit alcohol dehydrogenase family)|nr:YciK family oxidoreductase [Gammaproteobacteria bacterium]